MFLTWGDGFIHSELPLLTGWLFLQYGVITSYIHNSFFNLKNLVLQPPQAVPCVRLLEAKKEPGTPLFTARQIRSHPLWTGDRPLIDLGCQFLESCVAFGIVTATFARYPSLCARHSDRWPTWLSSLCCKAVADHPLSIHRRTGFGGHVMC